MDTHVEHCQPESEVVSALLSVYVACMLGSIYEHRQNMAAVEVLCYSGEKMLQEAPSRLSMYLCSIHLYMSVLYRFPLVDE